MENKVWLIIRPHYSPIGKLESVGICGSGFFIGKHIFISSHHVLNETSFIPNAYSVNNNIFLINPMGERIEITKSNIYRSLPEIDSVLIKINSTHDYFKTREDFFEGDEVKNMGYPSRNGEEILVDFKVNKQFEAVGRILKVESNYSMNANDVKIFNRKVVILDYSSELGFSGGPLLKGDEVIGVMSHLYPQNKNAVAISVQELDKFIK